MAGAIIKLRFTLGVPEFMHILAIALGGCLRAPPVRYGITEDTGGHIAYILGAMAALARDPRVTRADIVTRLFDDPALGNVHAQPREAISAKSEIIRIDSGNRHYLAKEDLARDRAAFTRALIEFLRASDRRPDIIHAHFADAADVARQVRNELGIPFIYTAHSLAHDKAAMMQNSPALAARLKEEDRAIAAADAIIASSRDECERQLPAYPSARFDRIHRLRPGVDVADVRRSDLIRARRLVEPFLRQPSRPMILAIARPVHKKNLVRLVEAFGSSRELSARANLVILPGLRAGVKRGEAEHREVLIDLVDAIDRHDLHGVAAWPSRHDSRQVAAMYELARRSRGVFVNPALTEPYGLTLIEAASHGLPVVATRNGGPSDIVAELEHGLLINPLDPEGMQRAMLRMLDDEVLWQRCSRNALVNIGGMNWRDYANGFLSIAQEIASADRTGTTMRPQRMLISDIDNTLTGCRKGARRLSAFLTRKRASVGFGVATGRSFVEARRLLREWDMPVPDVLIASVGSEIYWRTGRGFRLDEDYAAALAKGWNPDAVLAAMDDFPDLVRQAPIEQRRFKCSFLADGPDVLNRVRDRLASRGIAAKAILSHDRLLDILPVRAGKHAALAHVAAVLELPCDRIVAAGDSGNDVDMLAASSQAVLVANFHEEVRGMAGLTHVYTARRSHAAGVLEGLLWHQRRSRTKEAAYVAA